MNAQIHKDLVIRPSECQPQFNRQLVETFLIKAHAQESIALDSFVCTDPDCWGFPEFNPRTLGEYQGYFAFLADVFAESEFNIEQSIAEGTQVLVRFSLKGIHREEFMGLTATHGELKFSATQLFKHNNVSRFKIRN